MPDFDHLLVGGGLQSGLLVLALQALRPGARIAVVEAEDRLGGEHTWCHHAGDLSPAARRFTEPLVARRWPGYEVRFPRRRRVLDQPYTAWTSARLRQVVGEALQSPGCALLTGRAARILEPTAVELEDGDRLSAGLVVDARGAPAQPPPHAGFQVFLGRRLRLAAPHGLRLPLLMDAEVEQIGGFRFLYLLPLDGQRVLVEDTRFTDSPRLDEAALGADLDAYVARRGWRVEAVEGSERGVLPMPWRGRAVAMEDGVLRAGWRGGWFHPATGYSLPVAARLAEAVASAGVDGVRSGALEPLLREHRRQRRYAHLLNLMLFRCYPPAARRNIFERFYGLSPERIARFYALRLRGADQLRLVAGRPPAGLSLRRPLRPGWSP